MSRVLKSSSENFIVEVTWDPPDPDLDSRTDFYHYQVLDGLQEENASVALDFNTTNTTVIIDLNGLHTALFVLSAWNCEGTSTPVAIVIHNGENKVFNKDLVDLCIISIMHVHTLHQIHSPLISSQELILQILQ